MNGVHDLGGMMGFGPVVPETNEPVFHAEWERRYYGLRAAMGPYTAINIDESRFRREQTTPAQYLTQSYYENFVTVFTKLMRDRGFVTEAELVAGHALASPKTPPGARVDVAAGILTRRPYTRDVPQKPKFALGGKVRARNLHPKGHTRLPRYVRGHAGEIVSWHGAHVFPDSNALGQGEAPQHLYTVRFAGTELWGAAADPTSSVSVEAWESYLEPVA
jgi:nitrile hydratase subunit beta